MLIRIFPLDLSDAKEAVIKVDRLKSDSTAVEVKARTAIGVSTSLVTIKNGGHTIPGREPFNIGFALGSFSQRVRG